MRRAIFPGTFDPFTIGHYDIVRRGLSLFDEIVVAIGVNPDKKTLFSTEERFRRIDAVFCGEKRVKVALYSELTVDFARHLGVEFIIRGLRTAGDFDYEQSIAHTNRHLSAIETIFLPTDPRYSYISSSLVRQLIVAGKDVTEFLPPEASHNV